MPSVGSEAVCQPGGDVRGDGEVEAKNWLRKASIIGRRTLSASDVADLVARHDRTATMQGALSDLSDLSDFSPLSRAA